MSVSRFQNCGAVLGKRVYMFGSIHGKYNADTRTTSSEYYDYATDTYTQIQPIPTIRESCAAAVLNQYIYVAGGTNDGGYSYPYSNKVSRYDTIRDEWRHVSDMNRGRRGLQLVSYDGYLYAIGGKGDNSVEKYKPSTDSWSFVANSNYKHEWGGAVAYEDMKIYVYSGEGFEVYYPESNVWYSKQLPNDRNYYGAPLVLIDRKLWTMGGIYQEDGGWKTSKLVFSFDPSTYQWTKHHDMDTPRAYYMAFVINH